VEERDEKTGSDPEIESHRWKKGIKATDEAPAQDSDEDVEAHRATTARAAAATDEPGSDESDDVELHRKKTLK
jgi:hypothetical protein